MRLSGASETLSAGTIDNAIAILTVRFFVATQETPNQAFSAIHNSLLYELCIPFSGMQDCGLLCVVTCMRDYRRGLDW
jgi:hypothetical protein